MTSFKTILVLGLVFCHAALAGQTSSTPKGMSTRIEECRVKLKDIERLRNRAVAMGSISAFEDLTARAKHILADIENGTENPELQYLLGECQGILNSLLLTLEKPLRQVTKINPEGRSAPSHKKAQSLPQMRTRSNSYMLEPLPKKDDEDNSEEVVIPVANQVPTTSFKTKTQRHTAASPENDDMNINHPSR